MNVRRECNEMCGVSVFVQPWFVCKTKTDKSELGQGKGREGEGWEMFEFSVDDDRYP